MQGSSSSPSCTFDVVPLDQATRHISTSTTAERFEDLQLGRDFENLSGKAEDIGMKINTKKTQLLVISPMNGCDTSAEFTTSTGERVESIPTLKLVGFTFGAKPGAGAHVEAIAEQYQKKKWMLYHLRDAGFKGKQLFCLYCCYVRSGIEYCSVVYHSLLNGLQGERLERLQRHAVRVCFGYDTPVEETMEAQAIQSLKERRVRRCDKFITKAMRSDRFGGKWFPVRGAITWDLRQRRNIQEMAARTVRRFNSPLAFLRRRANEMGAATALGEG